MFIKDSKHGCLCHKMESHDQKVKRLTKLECSFGIATFIFSKINKLILLIKSYKILCENTEVLCIEVEHVTIWTIYSNLCCRN